MIHRLFHLTPEKTTACVLAALVAGLIFTPARLFAADEPAPTAPAAVIAPAEPPAAPATPAVEPSSTTIPPVAVEAETPPAAPVPPAVTAPPPPVSPVPETTAPAAVPPAPATETGVEKDTKAPKAPQPMRDRRDLVTIGTSSHLRANEMASQMVTVFGSAIADGRVHDVFVTVFGNATANNSVGDNMVAVFGNATVNGPVGGNLVCVFGQITLGPDADVRGELVSIGSSVIADPAAVIRGQKIEVPLLGPFGGKWFGEWIGDGLSKLRLLPHQHLWAWAVAGVLVLLHVLFYLLFPRPVDATASVIERKPGRALMYAIMAFLLMPIVAILLAITVIGPALLFLGKLLATFIGTIAIYRFCGSRLGLKDQPVLALLAGNAMFVLLYAIPVVSIFVWFLVGFFGFGAALAALVESMRRESRADNPTRPGPGAPARGFAPAPAVAASAAGAGSSAFVASPPVGGASAGEAASVAAPGTADAAPLGTINGVAGAASAVATADAPTPAALVAAGAPAVDLYDRVACWPRAGAAAIDFIIVMATVQFLNIDFLFPYAWLAYHIAFWSWRATTIGGVVLNLRIVRLDGGAITFPVAAVRSLASIFSIIPIGLGFLWASWDENVQSWHDKIAGTTIVRVPRGQPLI